MTFPSDPAGGGPPRESRTEAMSSPANETLGALANLGWQALITIGLASIALGVVVLAWPHGTLRVVGVAFGVYLLVSGVFQLAAAFGAHVPGHLRALHFITGAVSVLLGLISFRGTLQSIFLLALWIGFSWLLRGIMMTAAAGSAPAIPARGWQMFLGVITLLAGVVLIVSPFSSIAVLTLVAGIMAIVLGVVEVFHAIRLRVEAGRLTPGTTARHHRSLRSMFHMHPHPQH
ncbi:HdeD family acid-resistance protein (plasmid) [Streptomyces sp. BHT-5-2]|uniref:HdeD family acid-resistance protein n=1 Tax=unclassified Streptomyces TaxID=2593676 RepID=UPI001C8F1230|nr:HdeD family acid-resistance protein [Streptomyces sp. BHT-5-2]QZL07865.1 HdeD family acid-resistance protein [Streptomyces sp. BHT-5-2]